MTIHSDENLIESTDAEFRKFVGTEASDASKNISTNRGGCAISMPHLKRNNNGWKWARMVKVVVNGDTYWKPQYDSDLNYN